MAKSLEERLAEMDAEHAKARAVLVRYDALLQSLPSWLAEYKLTGPHFHKLYGETVSVKFERPALYMDKELKSPDLAFVGRLMAEFPPLPCVLHAAGCKSFRLASYKDEREDARAAITPVAGFVVRIEVFQERRAEFEWRAAVGAEVVRFQVALPIPSKLAGLQVKAETYRGEVVGYEYCDCSPGCGAQSIKWASGGPKYPNSFTLYWLDPSFTFAQLAELLA